VPIFKDSSLWGTMEIRFREIGSQSRWGVLSNPFIRLLLFVGAAGFMTYLLFLKKTLRHLDPTSVVPERVKLALDTLTEGVILLNKNERIVMVNSAFARRTGQSAASLLGKDPSELKWIGPESEGSPGTLPWTQALQKGERQDAVPLALPTKEGVRNFLVNAAPILDAKEGKRGALATFSDVTQLEERNTQLKEMLDQLEESRKEIHFQNQKLKLLATMDPLTRCLNRRALF
ncbi:unnamed protein product, partial [marine sediment metagenome]